MVRSDEVIIRQSFVICYLPLVLAVRISSKVKLRNIVLCDYGSVCDKAPMLSREDTMG